MKLIDASDNYEVEKNGETVDMRYHSNRGKVKALFDTVEYSSMGFQLLNGTEIIGEIYQEWGKDGGGWYFVPATGLMEDIVETEIRIPEEMVISALDAVQSKNITGEAAEELRHAKNGE